MKNYEMNLLNGLFMISIFGPFLENQVIKIVEVVRNCGCMNGFISSMKRDIAVQTIVNFTSYNKYTILDNDSL